MYTENVCDRKSCNLNGKLLYCGKCGRKKYCSKLCQKIDWKKKHKDQCQLYFDFQKWLKEDSKNVNLLPKKGSLVWFDDGMDQEDCWINMNLAKDLCNKPRFNNKIIYPATAISSLVYGGNKDEINFIKNNAKEIGLDEKMLSLVMEGM